jgi:hypothetical protein
MQWQKEVFVLYLDNNKPDLPHPIKKQIVLRKLFLTKSKIAK